MNKTLSNRLLLARVQLLLIGRKVRAFLSLPPVRACVQLLLIGVAVGFLVFGVIRKEHKDVERKATNICLECIGIG